MSAQINYLDTIRFRTSDGKYVRCPGADNAFTLVDTPDEYCNFTLREYNYNTSYGFCYSGNLNADTIDCRMNFRLCQEKMHDDTKVVSVDIDRKRGIGNNVLFNGIGWGPSGDYETFLCFDPFNLANEGPISHGSKVIIRNMAGSSSNNLQKFFNEIKTIENMTLNIQSNNSKRLFLVRTTHGSIAALSPEPLHDPIDMIFTIEKV